MISTVRQSQFFNDILSYYDRYEAWKDRDELVAGIVKIDPSLADKRREVRKFLSNLQITRKRQMDRFLANAVRNNPRLFDAICDDTEVVYREIKKLEKKNPAMMALLQEFFYELDMAVLTGGRVPAALQTKLAKLLYQCRVIEERKKQIGTLNNFSDGGANNE